MAGRIALLVGSILLGLCVLELGLRALSGPQWLVEAPNLVLRERASTRLGGEGRVIHDDRLGFVPRPGFSSPHEHYDERGFRRTPTSATGLAEPPILVVGDSFAHGDEVDDGEAWPALLQSLVGRRVVNAAMSGYGLDQAVLRAEIAAAEVRPAAIVLSFIADDSRRSEMKRVWGVEKPYFELVDGKLVERNIPVPPAPEPADTLDIWQRLFGWSVLVETTLERLGWWYEWMIDYARVLQPHEGERLACPLFERLSRLGVPTLVVAEHDPFVWRDPGRAAENRRISGALLKCAAAAGLPTLDVFDTIDAGVRRQGLQTIFRLAHPGPAGTALAARRIAEGLEKALEERHIPPR